MKLDYEELLMEYGRGLSEADSAIAYHVLAQLYAQGKDYEWLYYAVQHLNGRSFSNCPNLLFFKPYQAEVDELVLEAHEKEAALKARQLAILEGIELQMKQRAEREVVTFRPRSRRKEWKNSFDLIEQLGDE